MGLIMRLTITQTLGQLINHRISSLRVIEKERGAGEDQVSVQHHGEVGAECERAIQKGLDQNGNIGQSGAGRDVIVGVRDQLLDELVRGIANISRAPRACRSRGASPGGSP